MQKNGERDSPRLCSSQNGVYEPVEQWPGGSAGQLLEASETDCVREGQLRFIAASRSLPCIDATCDPILGLHVIYCKMGFALCTAVLHLVYSDRASFLRL